MRKEGEGRRLAILGALVSCAFLLLLAGLPTPAGAHTASSVVIDRVDIAGQTGLQPVTLGTDAGLAIGSVKVAAAPKPPKPPKPPAPPLVPAPPVPPKFPMSPFAPNPPKPPKPPTH